MSYKPLLTAAPAHSILNAEFRYTKSTETDIRRTFARIRREQAALGHFAAQGRRPSDFIMRFDDITRVTSNQGARS